ncbi:MULTISPECIES: endonuclease/exonuclease/phosphatase [Actinomadura]|uniref:Endonuclease/exonuclease/phosphatase n=1 Tax=Actinomadura yumaensis TaxID=111807 RepID=A0ABW2CCT1_9ACTN|nr:endonuclease/exonuclease/phosphatase [Actinomadura sp. J1-007]MWK33605.1 endonuclease/exonuclease/phosphatase [Actinomadura sp. J1-007]
MANAFGTGRTGRAGRTGTAIAAAVLAAAPFVAAATAPAAQAAAAPSGAAAAPSPTRIRDVQGARHVSPLNGRDVAQVPGVVTALTSNGFWMQDPRPDRNPATSEGVFVFTRTRPSAAVGDAVRVDGKVSEFRPGGPSSANLSRTEIDATATAVDAHGRPLPPPVVIGPGGRRPPHAPRVPGAPRNVEKGGRLSPARSALDFYEALEGMRVRIENAVAVGPTRDGRIPVLPAGGKGAGPRTKRGGVLLREGGAERVLLDDALAPLPAVNVGDRLPGAVEGVIDYVAGDFTLLPTAAPKAEDGRLPREATRAQRPGELAVATAGLDGLSPDSPRERYETVARDVVDGLKSPDLIAVGGMDDNSGPKDDGTVAADQTAAELITAISAAGGPAYDWRSVSPRDNADGGQRGANDRAGFLFRTDRGLSFVDRPAPSGSDDPPPASRRDLTVAATRATASGLTLSPGRIAPANPVWSGARKPLAGEVRWKGRRIVVVAGQWYPRTSDDQPVFGRHQPPRRPTEWRRDAQSQVVAAFVRSLRGSDVIVAGDLNEGESTVTIKEFTRRTGLADLPARLPAAERYTTVASGDSQVTDHILISPSLARRKHEFDVVHREAEFADRPGDRDPTIVRIDLSGRGARR